MTFWLSRALPAFCDQRVIHVGDVSNYYRFSSHNDSPVTAIVVEWLCTLTLSR